MNRIFAILTSVVFLASVMQISVSRHYCGGILIEKKVSLTGKLASCGMEKHESSSPVHQTINKKCCEDNISFYNLSYVFAPEPANQTDVSLDKANHSVPKQIFFSGAPVSSDIISLVIPPGDLFFSGVMLPDICVFRI